MNHLVLDTCVLSSNYSPVSDILKNDVEYEKISLGYVKTFDEELQNFWSKLAKTVIDVDATGFDPSNTDLDLLKILSYFSKLSTVSLDQQKFLAKRDTAECETKFSSVQKLHLTNYVSDELDRILWYFPNISSLYIETTQEETFGLEILQNHACILKRLIIRASAREWVNIIIDLQGTFNLQLETLECKIGREQTLHLLLDHLPQKEKLLQIILHTDQNLTTMIPKLKVLHIDFIKDLISFKPFQLQTDLEELHLRLSRSQHRFQHQNSECFFGHEVIPLSNLKKLYLEDFNDKNCVECYENLFQSCSNLETLSIVQTTVATGIFDLLLQHQRKLSELRIELARISEAKIHTFCTTFPQLRILDLKATVIQGCSDSIIHILCQNLPLLTELRVTMLDITETAFDHVANHCHNIETLYLSIGGNFDLERIFRPFECLPRLKRICKVLSARDLTRIDYHEVFNLKIKDMETYIGRKNWTQMDYYTITWDVEEGNAVTSSDSFSIRSEIGVDPEYY